MNYIYAMRHVYKTFLSLLILFSSFATDAQSWVDVGTPGFSPILATGYKWISIDRSGIPYVVYQDAADSDRATVMRYNGSSWETVGSQGFSAGEIDYASITFDTGGMPYVVYGDYSADDGYSSKATVMKYNGSSWQVVGTPGFSASQVAYVSIIIDRNDTPYVAYEDEGIGGPASVMKFNGSNWVTVGGSSISAGEAGYVSMAIDSNDTPYIAYQDYSTPYYGVTVKKYNGSSWVTVGISGFSVEEAFCPSIALDNNGTPYVVYSDYSYDDSFSQAPTVMKYSGGSWVNVGIPGFSGNWSYFTSIALDNNNTPYVIYLDGHDERTTVKKYNGSNWVAVGHTEFSVVAVSYPDIAIVNRVPYVVYSDSANGKATVMKFDSSLASIIGTDTLCIGHVTSLIDTSSGGVWSSSNAATALVGSSGIVTGLMKGSTIISYTVAGFSVTFNMVVDSLPIEGILIASRDSICPGDTITLSNTVTAGIWLSADTSIATISSAGLLKGKAKGAATILYIVTNACGTDSTRYFFVINCLEAVINIPTTTTTITTSPNPTTGSFTLNISTPQTEFAQITITNIIGEKVKELITTSNQDTHVELDTPPGIYFISAVTAQGKQTSKIVVW